MATQSISVTEDGTFLVGELSKNYGREYDFNFAVQFSGTFGSGTLTFSISPDGGTSKIPLRDGPNGSDNLISHTSDGQFLIDINSFDTLQELYVTLSGATNPDITVLLHDPNRTS